MPFNNMIGLYALLAIIPFILIYLIRPKSFEKIISIITEAKESVIKLIDRVDFPNYEIILRNFLDILIENEDTEFNMIEKLHLFKYLILFHHITQKDLKEYYQYWKKSKLKVIFGNEIENING